MRALSDDETWEEIETRLGQRLIRVYDLQQRPVRWDGTSADVYYDAESNTLFRHEYRKDHQSNLAQFKMMLGALDFLGILIATLIVASHEANDGLYLPPIERSRQVVGQGSRLYIGDSKMGALATRAFLQASGDFYFIPLSQMGEVPRLLTRWLQQVWAKEQAVEVERIWHSEKEGSQARPKLLTLRFETVRRQAAVQVILYAGNPN